MANVNIKFNGKEFLLSCQDGQEDHLVELSIHLNNKFNEFRLTSNLNLEYTYLNELNLEQHKTTLIETYDFLLHIPEIDSIQQIESSIEIYSINQMSLSIKQIYNITI